MKRCWDAFRRFLIAEEVPRWFGLSLVLIYLVGLMAVGQFGIAQTRSEAIAQFRQDSQYAIKQLADRLAAIDSSRAGDAAWVSVCNRMLREFAVNVPTESLRVVDGSAEGGSRAGRVIASTNQAEIGAATSEISNFKSQISNFESQITSADPGGPGDGIRLHGVENVRLPLPISGVLAPNPAVLASSPGVRDGRSNPPDMNVGAREDAGGESAEASSGPFYVEVVLPVEPPNRNQGAKRATTLGVVLVVLGALFLVYRCLREQLRSMSRIADRLELHRDQLEHEIGALRIGDGFDAVTQTWNRLVDLTQGLLDAVRQKEANEELSRVLQRSGGGALAEALHAVPDGIIYIADETRFEYLNSAACRMLGWNVASVDRPTLADAKSEGVGAKMLDLLRSALQADGRFDARVELIETGDAQGRDQSSYRAWLIPLQRARHSGECVAIVRDVSQQIRAERAREEFIAQVTHEFRTPLTNIRAYTETLSSGMFEDPQTISECYNVITKETRRLSRLIEDILSVSQLEVGSIELHADNVDLKTLLSEGVRDVRGLADEKNIDLQLVLPAKLELIQADRDKLAVVVNNLLGNAIKYTPPGGNVIVGIQMSAESVVLTFKDNGMGIAGHDQARVFEKFQRGSDPEVQNISGTGIGLYTAREIVRRHGGDIEFISEKGEGSTFMVRLPHHKSRASAMSVGAALQNPGINAEAPNGGARG
ncbi:MAG: ATP-binding protein [Phycisphaerales bacterium]|nr:ATP-binding protein [Phycisphaerales bacterium]